MAYFALRLRVPLVAVMVMVAVMVEATPPGIAKNPSHATCKIKKYKLCYNLDHVCPKFCPDQCYVECASCKPICGTDANPPPEDDPAPATPSSPPENNPAPITYSPPPSWSETYSPPPVVVTPTPPTPSYSPPLPPPTPATPTPSLPPPTHPNPPSTPPTSPNPPSNPNPPSTPPAHSYPPANPNPPQTPPVNSNPPPTPPTNSNPPSTPPAHNYPPPNPNPSPTPPENSNPPSTPPTNSNPPSTPPAHTYPPPNPNPSPTPPENSNPPSTPPTNSNPPSTPPAHTYPPPNPNPSPTPPENSNPPSTPPTSSSPPSTPPAHSNPPATPNPPTPSTPNPSSPSVPPPSSPTTNTPPTPVFPPRTPPTSVAEQPPAPIPPSSSAGAAKRVRCRNVNYPQCYNMMHTCPSACPGGCEVDCVTCKPVCHCDRPGAVCQDPRFIGGDGITFYFHGKKDANFCLVSDPNLHINAHFIGKRNPTLKRDFTWVQSLGILFQNHRLLIAAKKTAVWDDATDRLTIALDGQQVTLPGTEGSQWQHPSENPTVEVVRLGAANHVMVEVKGLFRITAKVVPITEEDSRIHNYGITKEDSFAHLDVGFKFYGLSGEVDGILGQTYGAGYVSSVNVKAAMAVMGHEEKFETSSLFAPDCAVATFGANQRAVA